MKRKILSVLLAGALAGTMLMGCGSGGESNDEGSKTEDSESKEDSGKHYKFAYTCMDGTNPFFVTIEDEIKKQVEAKGVQGLSGPGLRDS